MKSPIGMKRLSGARFIPRLLRTTAFRYTLAYFLLFMASFGGIGYFVFASTLGATMQRLDDELVSELKYLAQRNEQSGSDGWAGLNAVVNEIARLKIVQKDALYTVLVGPPFREITSDLQQLPPNALTAEGMFQFEYEARIVNNETGRVETEIRPAVGRIGNFIYRGVDGENVRAIILTARDISDVTEIRDAAQNIVVRTGIFSLFLALALGAVYTGTFLRRVDQIGQTVKAIKDGDLTRRIALMGTHDEFDTLSDNINAMLDQIERLMTGMRQVSDNIAHDLRSPLTRIKARLENALADKEADLEVILDKTTTDVERLLATFNALLSITRIEAGEGGGTAVAVDVSAVAEEMADLYEPAASDEGFVLNAHIEPTTEIMGSRELISQAIANLLDNALKYAKRTDQEGLDIQPTIEITVAPHRGGGVLLSVMDNGPGVSEADQERILQRFVRLERSRSTVGNGLGLSLVSAIARRHRAQLTIGRGLPHHPESRALAKPSDYGLGVRIAFPASAKPARRGLAPTEERPARSENA